MVKIRVLRKLQFKTPGNLTHKFSSPQEFAMVQLAFESKSSFRNIFFQYHSRVVRHSSEVRRRIRNPNRTLASLASWLPSSQRRPGRLCRNGTRIRRLSDVPEGSAATGPASLASPASVVSATSRKALPQRGQLLRSKLEP